MSAKVIVLWLLYVLSPSHRSFDYFFSVRVSARTFHRRVFAERCVASSAYHGGRKLSISNPFQVGSEFQAGTDVERAQVFSGFYPHRPALSYKAVHRSAELEMQRKGATQLPASGRKKFSFSGI